MKYFTDKVKAPTQESLDYIMHENYYDLIRSPRNSQFAGCTGRSAPRVLNHKSNGWLGVSVVPFGLLFRYICFVAWVRAQTGTDEGSTF